MDGGGSWKDWAFGEGSLKRKEAKEIGGGRRGNGEIGIIKK